VVPPMKTVTGYGSRIAVDSAHAEYIHGGQGIMIVGVKFDNSKCIA